MKKIIFHIEGVIKGDRITEFTSKIASLCYQYLYKKHRKVGFNYVEADKK